MPLKTKAILFDIQHAAIGISQFVDGKTLEDYSADLMLKSAVQYQFAIIGEAMNRLRAQDPAIVERISEYQRIIGFRNVLIHGYDQVNDAVTWKIIQEKLPILQQEVEDLLKE
jgi:uncharacterized protein with HEPN domain